MPICGDRRVFTTVAQTLRTHCALSTGHGGGSPCPHGAHIFTGLKEVQVHTGRREQTDKVLARFGKCWEGHTQAQRQGEQRRLTLGRVGTVC